MAAILVLVFITVSFFLWALKGDRFSCFRDFSGLFVVIQTFLCGSTILALLTISLKTKIEEVEDPKIALINGKYYLATGGQSGNWKLDIWNPNKKTYRELGYNIFGSECNKRYFQ